ncbi:kinase domain protein [Nannochloropsis gaditana]|uniref:Acylphosphatase n=1 Tax=Nannochloropsis gaditana TaxID=72520 RepID=W7TTP0_9STRA|nr:kinase domain protein [Nannochloropsis gaditana]
MTARLPPQGDHKFRRFNWEVFGKVQGVFFRKYTKMKAQELGVCGWCMNTGGGTVIGSAEGSPESLEIFRCATNCNGGI